MIKTVLFDLDGTLLPLDMNDFMLVYLKHISSFVTEVGFDADLFLAGLSSGIKNMMDNDGSRYNHTAFWDAFYDVFGNEDVDAEKVCGDFYSNDFGKIRSIVEPDPHAAASVRLLRDKGYRLALATNPLFPATASWQRCEWAGLDPNDFELITTYEDYRFAKPSYGYYNEVLDKLGAISEECMMVGNDIDEDMVTAELGMDTFLVTPFMRNRRGIDIAAYKHGTLQDLYDFVKGMPEL
ncbi:MAG: HAD family hydrolase [Actinobacteria bacterium]|nr:HAD family hydrolase [Actinomycetota bacterium]